MTGSVLRRRAPVPGARHGWDPRYDARRVRPVTVIVVGAGVAGLSCARALADAGVAVRVLDRARVVGGRLASRRYDGRPADIGAAYLTADDPDFAALVARWHAAGLARPWTDTLMAYDAGRPARSTRGPVRWAAPGGLRTLAEELAAGLDVHLQESVAAVAPGPRVDGEPADAVVLAMPGPQALRVLDHELRPVRAAAGAQRWSPVLAAVLHYPNRQWGAGIGGFVNGHPLLANVHDDGDRRGDAAAVLVVHSTSEFAVRHLDDPAAAGPALERATRELLALPDPAAAVHVHRWSFAQPEPAPESADHHLTGAVALAGDAFGRPRVQTAWLSGRAAGRALAAQLRP